MTTAESQTLPMDPDSAEPRAGRHTVPVWLFVLLFLLLYWGMVYFDQHSGWFDKQVYAPYRSVEQLVAMQPSNPEGQILIAGRQLFHDNCAVCHMDTGVGNPANGCPPLDGSEWVAAAGPDRIIRIVSKGLTGPISVKGQTWSTGTMLPIGDQLPGDEKEKAEKIAGIISYIRKTFGKNASLVTPDRVFSVRSKIATHSGNFTTQEIQAGPESE